MNWRKTLASQKRSGEPSSAGCGYPEWRGTGTHTHTERERERETFLHEFSYKEWQLFFLKLLRIFIRLQQLLAFRHHAPFRQIFRPCGVINITCTKLRTKGALARHKNVPKLLYLCISLFAQPLRQHCFPERGCGGTSCATGTLCPGCCCAS